MADVLSEQELGEVVAKAEVSARIVARWRIGPGNTPVNWVGKVIDVYGNPPASFEVAWTQGTNLRLSRGVVAKKGGFPNAAVQYLGIKLEILSDSTVLVIKPGQRTYIPVDDHDSTQMGGSARPTPRDSPVEVVEDSTETEPERGPTPTADFSQHLRQRLRFVEDRTELTRNELRALRETTMAEMAAMTAVLGRIESTINRVHGQLATAITREEFDSALGEVEDKLGSFQDAFEEGTPQRRTQDSASSPLSRFANPETRRHTAFSVTDVGSWRLDQYETVLDQLRKEFTVGQPDGVRKQTTEILDDLTRFLQACATFGGVADNRAALVKANRFLWALQATRAHHRGEHDFSACMSKYDAMHASTLQTLEPTFSAVFAETVAEVPRPAQTSRAAQANNRPASSPAKPKAQSKAPQTAPAGKAQQPASQRQGGEGAAQAL